MTEMDKFNLNLKELIAEVKEQREGALIPAVRFKTDDTSKLIAKLQEELGEVVRAVKGDGNLVEEIVDLQFTAETFLHSLGLSPEQRRLVKVAVKHKNKVRGYYAENPSDEQTGL